MLLWENSLILPSWVCPLGTCQSDCTPWVSIHHSSEEIKPLTYWCPSASQGGVTGSADRKKTQTSLRQDGCSGQVTALNLVSGKSHTKHKDWATMLYLLILLSTSIAPLDYFLRLKITLFRQLNPDLLDYCSIKAIWKLIQQNTFFLMWIH